MVNRNIPKEAVELNVSWIDALENSLCNSVGLDITKEVMKAAGEKCSLQIFNDCMQILGKHPESIDDILNAMNQRRSQNHNLNTLWEKHGNSARLILEECNCTLVKAGLVKPNPTHCLCSLGMMENLFSKVANNTVNVELVKSIGNGYEVCEFLVTFT